MHENKYVGQNWIQKRGPVRTHKGFHTGGQMLQDDPSTHMCGDWGMLKLIKKLKDVGGACVGCKVYVTGHSLGAAMATIIARFLMRDSLDGNNATVAGGPQISAL